jgi:hypothetical protein
VQDRFVTAGPKWRPLREKEPRRRRRVEAVAGQIVVAYVVISASLTVLGLLLIHDLAAVTSWDEQVNRMFATS